MATQPVSLDEGALASAWANRGSDAAPAPSEQPSPAPAEGSTPPAEAAPVTAPVESPSPAQTPAPVVEDQDLTFALEKAGIPKDDPQALNKLAKFFRETNNRMGEMGRKLQEYERQPQPAPQQAKEPEQAPPVQPQQPAQTPEQYVEGLVKQDPSYQYLVSDYQTFTDEMNKIASHDPRTGRLTGGRIAEINTDISQLTALLGGSEALKRLNLQAPELDTFQQQEIRGRLTLLSAEKAELQFRFLTLNSERENVRKGYFDLKQRYIEDYNKQVAEREASEQEEQEINKEADLFRTEWKNTFESLATDKKAPKEMLQRLWNNLKRSAKSHDGAIMDLRAWMASEMDEEIKALDDYHRLRAGQYAISKREDAQVQTQPANSAAVAPPAPGTTGSWEDKLRDLDRARLRRA